MGPAQQKTHWSYFRRVFSHLTAAEKVTVFHPQLLDGLARMFSDIVCRSESVSLLDSGSMTDSNLRRGKKKAKQPNTGSQDSRELPTGGRRRTVLFLAKAKPEHFNSMIS